MSASPFPVAVRTHAGSTLYAPLLPKSLEPAAAATADTDRQLRAYFQLDHSLAALYADWAAGCPRMARVTACLPGVRVVRQDPWECLMSFICSSNNNVKRISLMLVHTRVHAITQPS